MFDSVERLFIQSTCCGNSLRAKQNEGANPVNNRDIKKGRAATGIAGTGEVLGHHSSYSEERDWQARLRAIWLSIRMCVRARYVANLSFAKRKRPKSV